MAFHWSLCFLLAADAQEKPVLLDKVPNLDRIHKICGSLHNQLSHTGSGIKKMLLGQRFLCLGAVVDLLELDINLVLSFQKIRIHKLVHSILWTSQTPPNTSVNQ